MARVRTAVLVVTVLTVLAAACGSGDSGTSTDEASGEVAGSFDVATYNAGLADGFVDHARERAVLVPEAVGTLGADVVFVQEVWSDADVDALTAGLADTYPSSFFLPAMPDDADGDAAGVNDEVTEEVTEEPAEEGTDEAADHTEVACPLGEAIPLEECARANCGDVPADQLADCVLSSCGAEFGATCATCQACLAANVGSSIDEAMVACTQGSAAYAYEGAFGIGFLSGEPFVEQDQMILESSLTRRAILYVEIEDPTIGTVHLFGTHLSPVFDDVPFPGEGSWEEEQAAQIEVLRSWVDEKAGDGVVVMLGDFNTGPSGELFDEEAPENYASLVAGDWSNTYVDDPVSECTFCNDNPLIGGDAGGGVAIDHVVVSGFDGTVDTRRILDGEVELAVGGGTIVSAHSDHYGVLVSLTP